MASGQKDLTTQIIAQAVALAQEHGKTFPIAPGVAVAHPDEPITASFDHYDGDEAVVTWPDGRIGRFPRYEVCEANLARAYAIRLRFGMTVDPAIRLEDHVHQITSVG